MNKPPIDPRADDDNDLESRTRRFDRVPKPTDSVPLESETEAVTHDFAEMRTMSLTDSLASFDITPPAEVVTDDLANMRTISLTDSLASFDITPPAVTVNPDAAADTDALAEMRTLSITQSLAHFEITAPPKRRTGERETAGFELSHPAVPGSEPVKLDAVSAPSGDTTPHVAPGTMPAARPRSKWLDTARTRLDPLMAQPHGWREVIYTPDIDGLLAEAALDDEDADVSEMAARAIGRIRSQVAVDRLVEGHRSGKAGALRALALVRDEAQSLPQSVGWQARAYAWLANTWRRLTMHPLQAVWRFVFATVFTWFAIGLYVWDSMPSQAIFNPNRWGKSVAYGLTVGVFMGLVVLLADEVPCRLRGFWTWWTRILLAGGIGLLGGTLMWGAYTYFFLEFTPDWGVMIRYGGVGLALAFMLTNLIRMPGWLAWLTTAICMYVPLFLAWDGYWNNPDNASIIYFRTYEDVYIKLIPVIGLMALGAHAQAVAADVRHAIGWVRGRIASLRRQRLTPAEAA